MSTTGTERHCRLCLMLNKGGTQACHHLLLKYVKEINDPYPLTVQQFLNTKKQTIKSKLSKHKFEILFPNDGDTVLEKWDLSLFCTVLTSYCDLKPSILRLDVKQLQNLRNMLCHMNEPNISVPDYKKKLEIIQVSICRLVQQIDEHNVKTEIENIIKNLESATLSLDETLKEMHAFYMMEMDIREKLDHVQESILQKLEQFDGKWELISKVLGEKEDSRINTATNNGLVPGVNIFLDLKNVSDEEEENMSDVLQQLFEEVIHEDKDFKSSIPADSYVRLRGAIEKTFKRFLSKGWRITRAKHECIQLHIECTNFTALAALFREQTQGLIDQQLTELNEALTECVSEKMLRLETTIYTDELWNVIDKAISCVEDVLKEHNIDMENQSDNAQLLGEEIGKHSLSLSAEKVGSDGSGSFEGDCNNKFATFLQLLKAELKTEFNTPNLFIQANCSTNVNPKSNDSSIDNKVELLEEQENTLTIGSDNQSPIFGKKEKENIKSFKDEEGKNVEGVFEGLSLKVIEPMIGTRIKQKEHSSGEKREIMGQVKMDIATAISLASTATDSKDVRIASVETEGDLHKNALHAILNSWNAVSVYYELASLTLIERHSSLWDNIYLVMAGVQRLVGDDIFDRIAITAIRMNFSLHLPSIQLLDLLGLLEGNSLFAFTEGQIKQKISRLHDLETRSEFQSLTGQMKNQTKACHDYLHYFQQLCKSEDCLFEERKRELKDMFLSLKEETGKCEQVEDFDIKETTQKALTEMFQPDHALLDKRTYLKLYKQKIDKQTAYLQREATQKALTEMFQPGPALLGESTYLKLDKQKIQSYHSILVSDPLFERDSNIVEDIKAFLSELTSPREIKLIEDPKQQGKKVQALSVSLKQPSEDDLKCSMSLKQNTEKDREESEPIRVQDKHISTASLQQRGERIALWCIQRIQVHFECMAVQMKRIQNSLSRFHTISLDKETTSIPIFLDCSNLIEEWSQVEELVRHCRRLNDSLVSRRAQSRYRTNYEKEERLRFLVKEL